MLLENFLMAFRRRTGGGGRSRSRRKPFIFLLNTAIWDV